MSSQTIKIASPAEGAHLAGVVIVKVTTNNVSTVVIAPIAPNVTWLWCPNVGAIADANARYPGDAYVDWTGLDGYSDVSGTPIPFHDIFADSYANLLALAPSKPIMIAETGCEESGGAKAAWIKDALEVQLPQAFPKVRGVCWFNWHWGGKTYEIESSPATLTAVKAALAGGYYKGAGAVPPSGKVPIP